MYKEIEAKPRLILRYSVNNMKMRLLNLPIKSPKLKKT